MEEYFFKCPYCLARISMVFDLSSGEEQYIEDCEVCCRPIQVHYEVEREKISEFQANALE